MRAAELPITGRLVNPHHDMLARFESLVSIKGKRCLCLGYDANQLEELVLKYRPSKVVLLTLWDDHKDAEIDGFEVVVGDIGERTSFSDSYFDFVLTFSVLEHISNLESAFAEIRRVLKPDGYFASLFGPAWSCSVGHHFYAKPGHPLFDFCQWRLPSHIHLLCSRDDIVEYYTQKGASAAECTTVMDWFYETNIINRRFFEDYTRLFMTHFYWVASVTMYSDIDTKVLTALREQYPGYHDFSTYGGSFLLKNMR